MTYSINRWFASAIAALCVVSLVSASAMASLELNVDTGSGFVLKDTDVSGSSVSWAGSQGGVVFDLLAGSSNSPGVSPQSTLNITTLKITNTNAFDVTVKVLVGDTGFTFPSVGPTTLASGIGGSVTTSGVQSISYQTWIDSSNTQNGMAGLSSGLLTQNTSGIGNGGGIPQLSNVVSGNIGSTPFAMTGLVTLVLSQGAAVNFSSSAVAAVPEASTIAVWSVLSLAGAAVAFRKRMSGV